MIHTNNPIIKHKVGLLNLAEELGNVAKACKVMGVSRDTFYRYQELVDQGGVDALINKNRRVRNEKNRIDPAIEQAVLSYAIDQPAHGQIAPAMSYASKGCLSPAVELALSVCVTT